MRFFETLGDATIVSRPRILTLDNQEAHILVGTVVPFPEFDFAKDTGVRTLAGFTEQEIGIELTVTPYVNRDDYITLDVVPKVEEITGTVLIEGTEQPIKSTRRAQTRVTIKDGFTMVIGGLIDDKLRRNNSRVPYIHRLPLIGRLFENKQNDDQKTELLIFVTPTILDEAAPLNAREQQLLDAAEQRMPIAEVNRTQ
jgi:type II secretory pathway component GspD/PulD (secretin)